MLPQHQEDEESKADSEKERLEMGQSSYGKAVLAVQQILQLVNTTVKEKYPQFKNAIFPVAVDDMVFLAKRMLELQHEFLRNSKGGYIDIGYHYTDAYNLKRIRTNGLLTKKDRQEKEVRTTHNSGVSVMEIGDWKMLLLFTVCSSFPSQHLVMGSTPQIIHFRFQIMEQLG